MVNGVHRKIRATNLLTDELSGCTMLKVSRPLNVKGGRVVVPGFTTHRFVVLLEKVDASGQVGDPFGQG